MLFANQLVGFGVFGDAKRVIFNASAKSVTDTTTYTFTNTSIGSATADRIVIVGVGGAAAGLSTSTVVTIGGSTATAAVDATFAKAGHGYISKLYMLAVPSGTTATIVSTFSAATNRSGICVWSAYGCMTTVAGAGTCTFSASTSSIGANPSGGAVGVAYSFSQIEGGGTEGSATWSGMTINVDETIEDVSVKQTCASTNGPVGFTTITFAATTPNAGCVALMSLN